MIFTRKDARLHVAQTALLGALGLGALAHCGPEPQSTPNVGMDEKWVARAKESYKSVDIDDAKNSVDEALRIDPRKPEARILAGQIALARLDFAGALKATEGVATTESRMIRGRAYWYSGELERAADELEATLRDPNVRDTWARDVVKLARRGQGRKPFQMTGGVVSLIEMPTAGPLLVVPCEIDGENVITLVSTGSSEVLIDSATRKEPGWINIKFGDRMEVQDVPAIPYDLSALSKQLQAPIRALLGVNLLRHLNATFDRRAAQFIVRQSEPLVPPTASRVPLYYIRGGAIVLRAGLGQKAAPTGLFVDTRSAFPVVLSDASWKQAGIDLATLRSDPALPANYKAGVLPLLRVGPFDVPQVPAIQGVELDDVRAQLDVNFGGMVGAGFLQPFRVTMGDGGRHIWLETESAEPPQAELPPPTTAPGLGAPGLGTGMPGALPSSTPGIVPGVPGAGAAGTKPPVGPTAPPAGVKPPAAKGPAKNPVKGP
jgi:tetratricopeptide (TPR) repeat protein